MDALSLIPASLFSFGAAYYLGKASLKLVIGSLEHSRRPAEQRTEAPAHGLRSADTVLS